MFKISFEFNETSKQVSNIKVTEIQTPKDNGNYSYEVEVEDNKLKLYPPALEKLQAVTNDRISVQYISLGVGKSAPVIGKAEVFTDRMDGNRLTAKGTVSFRGEKRETLAQFGTAFNLEPYKDGIWKMIPVEINENTDLTQEENDLENLNPSELDSELNEILTSINNDDLPF